MGAFNATPLPGAPNCPTGQSFVLRLFATGDPLDNDPPPDDRELRLFEMAVPCFDADLVNVPTGTEDPRNVMGGGDGRITGAFWHKPSGEGLLYVVHSVARPVLLQDASGQTVVHDQKVVRWYIIETNNWPSPIGSDPTIRDSGVIDAGTIVDGEGNEFPVHPITPAITANECGDVAIVAAETSITDNPTIVATGRFEDDRPARCCRCWR